MKLIIIAVVVLVLLAGGGAAFYFFNGGFSSDDQGDQTADQPTASLWDDPIFVEIDNLTIPIIRNRRIEKHVLLRVTLEMVDGDARDDVRSSMPKLKDAFIKNLYDYYTYQAPGQQGINLEVIKKRLKRAADRAVGKGKIRSVLIQGALERGARSN